MAIRGVEPAPKPRPPGPGGRRPRLAPSLAEVYRTIPVGEGAWWRKALAFAGPGYLVAVGYMDPGNWATDLAGGSKFGYTLLSVVLLSNMIAILLQGLASKLGIVTGRDLAQACRDHYSRPASLFLWVICEIAIAARSEEHTSELQSRSDLVCRLLLEKKKKIYTSSPAHQTSISPSIQSLHLPPLQTIL